MPPPSAVSIERLRSRALGTYFTAAALTSIAYIATFTIAALAAPQITDFTGSSGLPSAVAVAGTAVAAALLSSVMARSGRRAGIVLGLGIAVVGGGLAIVSVVVASLPLLLLASGAVGFGNAAMNLSRYAAADLYPPAGRAGALGLIVWGSTIGAVLGPNLVAPAGAIAPRVALSPLAGGFAMALLFLVAALAVAALGPRAPMEPLGSDVQAPTIGADRPPAWRLLVDMLRQPWGRIAAAGLITSQLVMTLIMTMTPFHLHDTGHGLETVGFVISAHAFGMFAFSPLSGRLTDRFGAPAMITAAFGVLATAGLLAAATPGGGGAALSIPLFLLGVGWNMGFVAGSSLLASRAPLQDRARLQGASDAMVWTTAALGSLVSGFVVAAAGYASLALIGAAIAILLAVLVTVDRRTPRVAEA